MENDSIIHAACGNYILSAVSVAIDHCFNKNANSKYIEKPIMQEMNKNTNMTEEEKQKAVDLFFAQEKARRVNWRRNHNKGGSVS